MPACPPDPSRAASWPVQLEAADAECGESDYEWDVVLCRLLASHHYPDDIEGALRRFGIPEHHYAMGVASAKPEVTAADLSLLGGWRCFRRLDWRLAAHPAAPPRLLRDIAGRHREDPARADLLALLLQRHPNTPPDVLEQLRVPDAPDERTLRHLDWALVHWPTASRE